MPKWQTSHPLVDGLAALNQQEENQTMKKKSSPKHRMTYFLLAHLFLSLRVVLVIGSSDIVDQGICEYQDAFLMFPNVPTIEMNKAVYKGDTLIASWAKEFGLLEVPSYKGRLKQIGESAIIIIKATQSDSGTYKLIYYSPVTNKSEASVNLQVRVSPTDCCIPFISRQGDTLQAKLPQDDCGVPMLIPKWMNSTEILVGGNISVLKPELRLQPKTYTACAVGAALKCFVGSPDKLCANYTLDAIHPQNDSSSMTDVDNKNSSVSILIILSSVTFVIGVVILFVCWKKKCIRRNLCPGTDTMETTEGTGIETPLMVSCAVAGTNTEKRAEDTEVEIPLMDLSTIGVRDIQRHLIDQYKTMMWVPLSACYEENPVDVSQVYCKLEISSLGIEGRENVTSENKSFSSMDAESVKSIPAMIVGECGSGKTTWCKNLVHQWCQYCDNNDSNLDKKDSSIPDIARFEIMLYIQLKQKLENPSFLDHVKNTLFANNTDCFEYTRCCIVEHRASVLLLIDGLDEVTCSLEPIVNLLKEKEMCPCSIVLTSRPSGLEFWREKERSLQFFEINGMRLESSKEYARKVLDILSRTRGETLNVDQFWNFANHIQVLSMCHVPFLCLSLIFIWIESKAILADLTNVLLMIVEVYLRRAMTREWYKANIDKVMEQHQFDISEFIAKIKNVQYLRDNGYILKVISGVAQTLWCGQMDAEIDKKSIEKKTKTLESGTDVKLCLQTGILLKTFRGRLDKPRSQIIFSHPLLFDLFVALSIAMEKGESFRRCITTKKSVVRNSCMIHMICQVAPKVGQEVIWDIRKMFEENNKKDRNVKTEESDQNLICNIESYDHELKERVPVKWLQSLMYMDELSNAKLSILTEGLKFTNDLTVFGLQLSENKKKLIFRLPILSKLHALKVDVENCTLLLDEEQEWNRGNFSELGKLVIKSVNIDVTTTGYIMEAVSICKHLRTLELCPKDDLDAQVLAISRKKTLFGWRRLAEGIKDMSTLNTVRLHNLQIREYLPALLESICKCPTIKMLDLMNLNEIDTGKILKVNAKDQDLHGCKHQEAKQSENSNILKIIKNKKCKTVQLVKNDMSEKSWQALSVQLESLSPNIVHIEQVHHSSRVVNELFQGICKCKDLEVLSICSIHAETHPVSFFGFRQLHKLTKFTFCNITMPDSSWKELSDMLARLAKLKELSLAHLEIKNCFIEVHKLSKVKLLELNDVHLDDGLWSQFGDEVMTLPKLKILKLVSCIMSKDTSFLFSEKMNHSCFHVEMEMKSNDADVEKVFIDMIVTSKRK